MRCDTELGYATFLGWQQASRCAHSMIHPNLITTMRPHPLHAALDCSKDSDQATLAGTRVLPLTLLRETRRY